MHRNLWLCLLLLLLLLPAVAVSAGRDLEDSRRELEEIQKRIGQTARTLEEKKKIEKTAVADLATVEKTLSKMAKRISAIEIQMLELDLKIKAVQGEIGHTGAEIDGLKGLVHRRLIALYKRGDESLGRTLFSPRSVAEITEDSQYWERIVRHDRTLLGDYRNRLTTQQLDLRQLGELRAEQEKLRSELRGGRDEMSRAARVKQQLLAKVRQDKDYLSRELAELKERAARVDNLIRKFETRRSKELRSVVGTDFAGQKGRLAWPVEGRVRIPFGNSRHPELGTPYQSHGIELEVTSERPVSAVWPGKVVFSELFKGYGNLLILDHGDGYYTLYAHLTKLELKVGEKVSRGAVLARTDRQEGRFYFEIRKGGAPLDPVEWLE